MKQRTLIGLIAWRLLVPAVASATIPEPVQTDTGFITGTSTSSPEVRAFKGIPYATPPLGRLRWRAPRPPNFRQDILKADHFGPQCLQGTAPGQSSSEDCLYLNVWTSATNTGGRQPVMLWIHGGAFTVGAGSLPGYDGEALARKGVVVVTVNYRLGPFGWLAHPDLTRESGKNASGNYGLMDVIAALQWVQANILGFGGDPRRVTIAGESAGAVMASALSGSPMAKGLFQRVVAESGAWMGVTMSAMTPLAPAEEVGTRWATSVGAASATALRSKSADELMKAAGAPPDAWQMIIDGQYVPEDLSATFAQGRQLDVDVLVGSNKDEGTFLFFGLPSGNAQQFIDNSKKRFGDLADAFLARYPAGSDAAARTSQLAAFRDELSWHMRTWAELQAKLGTPKVYVYYFAHEPPPGQGPSALGATHTAEIPYVFNNLPAWRAWTTADRKLADLLSSYLVNFLVSGDPNGAGLPAWPAFLDKPTSPAMVLAETTAPEAKPDTAMLAIYDALWARQKPR